MTLTQAAWLILGLDAAMIIYTLVLFVAGGLSYRTASFVGGVGALWLVGLRVLFSNGEPFPVDISGLGFFIAVLVGVGLFGAALLGPRSLRSPLAAMDQTWLLAPQAIRVLFGATRSNGSLNGWVTQRSHHSRDRSLATTASLHALTETNV